MSADAPAAQAAALLAALPPAPGALRFLVTAGPTAEDIDPVRFVTNRSTGRMGIAIAQAAVREGHQALLVLGATALAPPEGIPAVRVRSAQQMLEATESAFGWCQVLCMAAAPADYRPASCRPQKIRKEQEAGELVLRLERTPDILLSLLPVRRGQFVIGFSLDTSVDLDDAREKMRRKRMDMIVANTVASFAGTETDAVVLEEGYDPFRPGREKEALAHYLVHRAADRLREGPGLDKIPVIGDEVSHHSGTYTRIEL